PHAGEDLLRRGCLGERGEPAQIGEETGDVSAVAGEEPLPVLARDQLCHLGREKPRELFALPGDRFEQASVREGDRRLIRKSLDERDVRVAEGLRFATDEDDDADQLLLELDRHTEEASVAIWAGVGTTGV